MALPLDYYQGVNGLWLGPNFESGDVPISDDSILVPGDIGVAIAGSDQSLIDLDYLEFARGYKFDIGASGSRFIIDGTKIVHRGSGTLWHTSTTLAAWLLIDSDNNTNAATLDGANTTKVSVRKGNVTLDAGLGSGTLLSELDISFRNNPSNDAVVTVNCELHATSLLNMMAGLLFTNAKIPNGNITGGIWTHSNTGKTAIEVLQVGGTGIVKYDSQGTILTVNILKGGTLNLLDNDLEKTVTTLNLFPGGTLIYNPDGTTIDTFNDMGGQILIVRDAPPQGAVGGGGSLGGGGSPPAGF